MFQRQEVNVLEKRLREPRRFLQVLMGPRQVGKTTVVRQLMHRLQESRIPSLFFSADFAIANQSSWIAECWDAGRTAMRNARASEFVLILDEIQKIRNWSAQVKAQWDLDTCDALQLKVVVLGSSRVLLEKGLSESLFGRYEILRLSHWSYTEMREAFDVSLDQFLYFGGYPGAVSLMSDEGRFVDYVNASMVDASINRDILIDEVVSRPALLRQTFELGCIYSGQILSLNKIVGQMQDVGNAITVSNYLRLLNESCLVGGLQKYANDEARKRASIPKLQVYNSALRAACRGTEFNTERSDAAAWGRVVESALGAWILSEGFRHGIEVMYWRDKAWEVDFVIRHRHRVVAIEVKTNHESTSAGLKVFQDRFHPSRALVVGPGGLPIEQFLQMDLRDCF